LKFQFNYQSFLQSVVYILLISQVWTNAISHCYWLVGEESDRVEMTLEDGELENESEEKESKKEEKEKDNRFQADLHILILGHKILNARFLHSTYLLSLHHPDVVTPPPKRTAHLIF